MSLRYKSKTVIITGAANGLGKCCLETFIENGANVVFCDIDGEKGKELEKAVNVKGPGKCLFVFCDVTKEVDIKNVVEKTIENFEAIDCLVNNVGAHPFHCPIDDFSADDMRKLLDVNVVSCFLFSKFCLPYLRLRAGNIINISSLVAQIGQTGAVTYAASKGAIDGFSRALAIDEAKYSVRVNIIAPSNFMTPMWTNNANVLPNPEEVVQAGADTSLLGRFGTLKEFGEACLWLAAEATFCTGITLNLTGGAELNYGFKNRVDSNQIY